MNRIPIQLEAWESAPSPICTKLVNLDAAEQLLYQIMTLDYGYSDDDIRRLSGSETETDESDKWSERLCREEEAVVIECGGVYYEDTEKMTSREITTIRSTARNAMKTSSISKQNRLNNTTSAFIVQGRNLKKWQNNTSKNSNF